MPKKPTIKVTFVLMLCAAILFVTVFFTLNVLRYRALFSFEWGDEAVHNQLAWRTYRVAPFTSTLKGDQVFDQHFRPMWLLISLPYLPFPNILSWYFLLVASFAGCAIVFYFWANKRGGDHFGALIFSLAILFFPPLHQLSIGVFDPEKLAILFLSLMLFSFQQRRFAWFILFVVLSLCCKEIVAFTLLMFAFMLAIAKKPRVYWLSTAIISVCWLVVAYGFIIPKTMNVGYGAKYFPQLLGSDCQSIGCVIGHGLSNPISSLGVIFSGSHLRILALLLLPMAGLVVFAPLLLIPALACLGMILAVPGPLLINQHHWFVPALPFLFAGTVAGAQRLAGWIGKKDKARTTVAFRAIGIVVIFCCLLFGFFGGFVGKFHDDLKDDSSYQDLKSVFDSRIYQMDEKVKIAWSLVKQVPPKAMVTSNYNLLVPLATRPVIKEFGRQAPNYDYFDFDYILINLEDRYFGAGHDVRIQPEDLDRLAREIEENKIEPLYADSNYFLGRKIEDGKVIDMDKIKSSIEHLASAREKAYQKLFVDGFTNIRD